MNAISSRFVGIKLVVSDLDGTLTYAALPKEGLRKNIALALDSVSPLKRMILFLYEKKEIVFGADHSFKRFRRFLCWDYPYKIVLTDRSLDGLTPVIGSLSLEDRKLFGNLTAIQVRTKHQEKMRDIHNVPLWECENEQLKPSPDVFAHITRFMKQKGISNKEVMIIDDSPSTRWIAKTKFGFRVFPDNTSDAKNLEDLRSLFEIKIPHICCPL
jgi:hypothetical protein